jgi:thymidine phosphorylase
VKVGSGAFLPSLDSARELAETMVTLGEAHGVKTSAVLTDMDQPLGRTVGNALEVTESVAMLDGKSPVPDLWAVTAALAAEMLHLSGVRGDPRAVVADGTARRKWDEMVRAQGGDPEAALPEAPERQDFLAPSGGIVGRIDALKVGIAAWRLGAGRSRKEDPVSPSAGVVLHKVAGDHVEEGEPILELHAEERSRFAAALEALEGAVDIGPGAPAPRTMIIETIRG